MSELTASEAKRRIADLHHRKPDVGGYYCAECGDDWPCRTLRLLTIGTSGDHD